MIIINIQVFECKKSILIMQIEYLNVINVKESDIRSNNINLIEIIKHH